MTQFFGIAAGIVGLIGYYPYIQDILKGTTRPDRASWLIWTVLFGVMFVVQLFEGATDSLWLVGTQLLGIVVVTILSWKFGTGHLRQRDLWALSFAGLGVFLWFVTKEAVLAMTVSLTVEFVGVVLTAIKTYNNPASETLSLWVLAGVSGILGLLAVGNTTNRILYIYPIYFIIVNFGVVAVALVGKSNQQAQPAESGLIA